MPSEMRKRLPTSNVYFKGRKSDYGRKQCDCGHRHCRRFHRVAFTKPPTEEVKLYEPPQRAFWGGSLHIYDALMRRTRVHICCARPLRSERTPIMQQRRLGATMSASLSAHHAGQIDACRSPSLDGVTLKLVAIQGAVFESIGVSWYVEGHPARYFGQPRVVGYLGRRGRRTKDAQSHMFRLVTTDSCIPSGGGYNGSLLRPS